MGRQEYGGIVIENAVYFATSVVLLRAGFWIVTGWSSLC